MLVSVLITETDMSDDQSARLGLPYLAAGQMQKHVTLNEALTRLDALTQTAVVSREQGDQPGDPGDGDLYILPADAEGSAWSGKPAGTLMRFEAGGWSVVGAPDGLIAVVLDEPAIVARITGAWRPLGETLGEIQQLTRLGLGTTADAANPFAAKVNKALWTARGADEGGDGDLRFTFNKSASGDVLSLLFQSGWSGRAEIGLIGDDDLRLKVSPDGSVWHDALIVDADTGACTFPSGAVRIETTVLTADGSWTPPAWARWVEATAIGAGGGGGAGAQGAAGSVRFGGGGGGGGLSLARLPASALSAGISAAVGGGGAGGASAGAAGVDGGDVVLSLGGTVILTARGGKGGGGGDASTGLGGAGAVGDGAGAAGGAASTTATSAPGGSTPTTPGGGGAGGGLDAANTARAGGAGGTGASLRVPAAGGAGGSGAAGAGGAASPLTDMSRAGGGGGGGGASTSAGHAGGAGGGRGGGGGGGGAGVTGFGPGGAGAGGALILTAIG